MTTTLMKEDGVLYEAHEFHVHRYDDEVPFGLRAHSDTLGRFETLSSALQGLEDREHPENLHVETRVEYIEVECNCGTTQEDFNGGWVHYDDCNIVLTQFHYSVNNVKE